MGEKPAFTIRPARDDERAAINELTLRAYADYAHSMREESWKALETVLHAAFNAEEQGDRIVAEQDGRLIGSVLLFPASSDAYHGEAARVPWPEVRLLSVLPEARGQGVGRALMEACIRCARESGATEIGLHTSESMRVAMALYAEMGFERVAEYDFQPPGAELVEGYRLRLVEQDDPRSAQAD